MRGPPQAPHTAAPPSPEPAPTAPVAPLAFDTTPVDPDFLALDGHTIPEMAAPSLSRAALAPPEPEPPDTQPSTEMVDDGPVMIDDDSIISTDPGTFADPFAPAEAVTEQLDLRGYQTAQAEEEGEDDDDIGVEFDRTAVYSVAVDLARKAESAPAPAVAVAEPEAAIEVDIAMPEPQPQPQAISFEEIDPFSAGAAAAEGGIAANDPFAAHAAAADTDPTTGAPLAAHAEIAAVAPANLSEDLFGDMPQEASAAPPTPSAEPFVPGPAPLDPDPPPQTEQPPRSSVMGLVANGFITLVAVTVLLAGLAYFVLGDRIAGAVMNERATPNLPHFEGIRISSMRLVSYPRAEAKELLVAVGTAKSESDHARDDLYVVVQLLNEQGEAVLTARSPLAVALGPKELTRLTDANSVKLAQIAVARASGEITIDTGKELPYAVVFIDPPAAANELIPLVTLEKGDSFIVPPEPKPQPPVVEEAPEEAPEPVKTKRKRKKRKKKGRRKAVGATEAP